MFHHLQENIKDWTNVDELDTYFTRMLNKEVYNKTGLIYGIGPVSYTHLSCIRYCILSSETAEGFLCTTFSISV